MDSLPRQTVLVIGTADTKLEELLFLKSLVSRAVTIPVLLVDVSAKSDTNKGDITPSQLLASLNGSEKVGQETERGVAVSKMSDALSHWVCANKSSIAGVLGIGGSGGTALITQAMQFLPIGLPKVMLSTVVPNGDTRVLIGGSDITLMYSVTDICGINNISKTILSNAAHCLAGMIQNRLSDPPSSKRAVGLTMFGVTTPCVEAVAKQISDTYDPLVFHATGAGGQSLFKLVDEGQIEAVLDITTTEIADFLAGGIMAALPDRIKAVARTKVPYIGSVGALDMVNFGTIESVPDRYKGRKLYQHNKNITLMRTTPIENALMGKLIAQQLNECEGEVRFLIPTKGISALDIEGGAFWDPEATSGLVEAIKAEFQETDKRKLIFVDCHINDPLFSQTIVDLFKQLTQATPSSKQPELALTDLSVLDTASLDNYLKKFEPNSKKFHLMKHFLDMVKNKQPIVGGGAGVGLSAKSEEKAGIDLIICYNSGRYRMAGRGSLAGLLAYGNANQIVLEMANEILPIVKTPVLAGVNGTDPFIQMDVFLRKLKKIGFAGVQNFPTVGLIDGIFRANLEETGMSYQLEVDMIRKANAIGLLTTPYVFCEEDAIQMAEAGADFIVCHMGLTTGGAIGAKTTKTLNNCVDLVDSWGAAALKVNPFVIVLCHGGPISSPEDAQFVLSKCKRCHGFYGASSMERLPTEVAIQKQITDFKNLSLS